MNSMLSIVLGRCSFRSKWQQLIGKNITLFAHGRSHYAISLVPATAGAYVAPAAIRLYTSKPIFFSLGTMAQSYPGVRGVTNNALGMNNVSSMTREKRQLSHDHRMTFNLPHPPQPYRRRFSLRRGTIPDFRDCKTLEEVFDAAYINLDSLSPRNIGAFWTVVPRFLQKRTIRQSPERSEKFLRQFDKISTCTIEYIEEFDDRDLSTTALGFAKIMKIVGNTGNKFPKGSPNQILNQLFAGERSEIKQYIFLQIANSSASILPQFSARHLSNLMYAYSLVEYMPKFEDGSTLFDILALEAISKLTAFNSHDLSNMIWAYANVEESNPKLFTRVAEHITRLDKLSEFKPQGLSNIVWAYATAEESHPKLFKKVAEHITGLDKLSEFKSQELSNIVWAYATAEESHSKLFEKVVEHITRLDKLGQFKPQELSNIVWAYATAEESHPKLFKKVAEHITGLDKLGQFKMQGLSNIVWAYATAEESHPKLFKKVARHIIGLENLSKFKAQDLSNIVWAYATAEESHPKLFKKVAEHIIGLDKLSEFKAQGLSNIVWAYATAEESHPKMFKKVARHIIGLENLSKFKAQDLSNIVWAYATAEESNPKLFKKVAEHIIVLDKLDKFSPQNMSNIVWAYATAKEAHPPLFEKLAGSATKRQNEYHSQDITNLLWSFASNGLLDQHLFSSIEQTAVANLSKYSSQGLGNIAWAYTVVNVAAPSLFNELFINACLQKENEFGVEFCCQLHQWQLWQEESKSNISLHPSLQEKCRQAFLTRVPTSSAFQDDVFSQLASLGLKPEEEVLTKRGYRLDAVVEVKGKKIGIEVDGPSHFLGRKPTGSTILKWRQVTNLEGIPIVSVPYWEWNKLRKDIDKKQQYLRSLLHV